jgi:DNA-binding response OmpR family regulator
METILVVDDEPLVRTLLKRVLETEGFHILEASSGSEALDVCREHEGVLDLLLTDIKMPGMTGRELAAQARMLRPKMQIMYMTGFADEVTRIAGGLEHAAQLIEKPFNRTALLGRIWAMLARGVMEPLPPEAENELGALSVASSD